METSRIIVILIIFCMSLIIYLHIKTYLLKTKNPSIEQAEIFKINSITKNHKKTKNIYIVRVYSSFDENKKLLNDLSNTVIKSYKINNVVQKNDSDEQITLYDFMNGTRFSTNTMSYLFHIIKQRLVPTLEGIFSPLSITKNIYLNIGMKSKQIPILCTSQYDRCFLHVLKGALKVRLYDPRQSKYLYRDYQKKMRCLKNTSTNFYNSKINILNDSDTIQELFPNFSKAVYTDILLREGNLMYIPNFWWFTIEYQEDSISLVYTSNTIISYIYNKIY